MRRTLGLLALLALALGCGAAAQESVFKSANRTVAVYATVTTPDGRLATDLRRDQFDISDNGKSQPLTVFANEQQPITVVMLLDRSASMRAQFELVEQAAEQFVAALEPGDQARIGSFSNRIQVDPREFTSDHDALLAILRQQLQEEGPTPLWNAVNVGITALLHQEGRRVILVFTDGADSPLTDGPYNQTLNSVMKRADEENVMIYAIGLAGNSGPAMRGPSRGFGGPGGGRSGRAGRGGFGGGQGGFPRGRSGADDKPDPGLPKIAALTGGGYFELTSTDNLADTFKRIADELHHQYLLGFTPPALDGKTHRIDVHLTGADATVRARHTYLAARE